jgi:hypothetical protein
LTEPYVDSAFINSFSTLPVQGFGTAPALTPSYWDSIMFKISVVDSRSRRTLVVEGKLSEPWVEELRSTWRNARRDSDGRKLVIDLCSLTSLSREGEDVIFELMKEGAKFSCGAGILTRHVLKRLARSCRCEPQVVSEKKAAEKGKKEVLVVNFDRAQASNK